MQFLISITAFTLTIQSTHHICMYYCQKQPSNISCFKSIHGFNCLRSEEFFTLCGEQITRGHPFKLRVQYYRIDARKYFFSSRVVTIWNQLLAEIFNVVIVPAIAAKLRSCDLSRYLLQAVYICINFGFISF